MHIFLYYDIVSIGNCICFAGMTSWLYVYFQTKADTEQQEVWSWPHPIHARSKHCHS